jgi:putative DNA primase/helicase
MVNPLLKVRYAKGKNNLGKVKNLWTTWGEFVLQFSNARRIETTEKEYAKLSQDERAQLKNVNGYWFAAHGTEGRRRLADLSPRELLTLDVDNANVALPDQLEMGVTGLSDWEFIAHPTLSSTARKPRIRLVLPMSRIVPTEDFPAVSRIAAWYLDAALEQTDPVSYRPAQMMFRPVMTKDGAYALIHNKGALLDPYAMMEAWGLATYGDKDAWKDWSKLPRSDREENLRQSAKKAEVPTEKTGIVGAFCRAYDVESAIAEFIPDVYAPGENHQNGKPRYTYVAGSGANGVVVEDDGLFIYSHHGTDPCGDRLSNAFDMVRLHLFGDLDTDTHGNTSPGSLPSFKAMQKLAKDDKLVMGELMADRIDLEEQFEDADVEVQDAIYEPTDEGDAIVQAALAADPLVRALVGVPLDAEAKALVEGGPAKPPKDWLTALDTDENGNIKSTIHNVNIIVQNDSRTWTRIGYNEFLQKTVLLKTIKSKTEYVPIIQVTDTVNGDPWEDIMDTTIRAFLTAPAGKKKPGYGLPTVADRDVRGAVEIAAKRHIFHPVKKFFEAQEWDGNERLDTLLIRYLGCPDTRYHRLVIRLSLCAAVARTYEPGHKFDYAIIFKGFQGVGKSTFIRALAMGRWFGELHGDMSDKNRMVEQMLGNLIMELPELAGVNRSEISDVKAFISATEDTVRLAYAHHAKTYKRQGIFIGSTNDEKYLKDPTGNRRMWPVNVEVTMIDTPALLHEMPQVWAEAVAVYRAMRAEKPHGTLPLYLEDHDARLEAQEKQETARQENPDEANAGAYAEWLDRPFPIDDAAFDGSTMAVRTRVCGRTIHHEMYEQTRSMSGSEAQAVARALGHLSGWYSAPGCGKVRHEPHGHQRWLYRDGSTPEEIRLGYRIIRDDDPLI